MSDETNLAVVTSALHAVPAPLKVSFIKAIDQLLGGLTSIPAAWAKRSAQAIEDTTAARSVVAAAMANAVAANAINDPVLMQAGAEIYLPTAVRKARNRVQIAQSAAEHIAQASGNGDGSANPDEDWMNSFMRFAEDASSDRLQDLFGRILAGEVVRPGAFGSATLRAVSELDQSVAADFSWAWSRSVGDSVDYDAEFRRGNGFTRWKRLSEAGLMAPSHIAQFVPPYAPVLDDNGLWSPMQAEGIWLNILFKQDANVRWEHIEFTRVGREIGSLLPRPDFAANMRAAGLRLPTNGLTTIELNVPGAPAEVLWRAT